jgi:hypothetical protein
MASRNRHTVTLRDGCVTLSDVPLSLSLSLSFSLEERQRKNGNGRID